MAIKEQALTEGHPDIATSLISLGSLLQSQNSLAEAEPLYRRALAIREKVLPEGHPHIATSLSFLASIDATQGRLVEAQAGFARAAAIRATPANRDLASQARNTLFGHARSSIILASTSDPPRATQLRRQAFTAMQWPGRGATSRALAVTGAQRSTADPALRALARSYEDGLQKAKDLDRQLLAALGEIGAKRDPAKIAALRTEYDGASRELARLQQELATRFPAYASLADPEPLGIAEVQALLGPDEALVTFMLGRKDQKGFVFLVDREVFVVDWLPAGDPLGKAKVLRCAAAVGGCPQVGESAFDAGAAHELYKSLLGPVAARLKGKKQLIIAPDGPMLGLPFHLLVTEAPDPRLTAAAALRQAKWLIRDHAITVLPNVSSLKALRGLGAKAAQAARPFLGIGDPVIGTVGAMICPEGEIQLASAGTRGTPRGATGLATTELLRGAAMVDGQAVAPVEQVRALGGCRTRAASCRRWRARSVVAPMICCWRRPRPRRGSRV